MPLDIRVYLEDFDDLSSAHQAYLADMQALVAEGNPLANIGLLLATGLQRNVTRLNRAFVQKYTPPVLNDAWQANVLVFVGDAGNKLFTRRIADQTAVVIDLDLVIRLVLLIHLIGLDKEDDIVAPALAGFLLLSIVVPRDEQFPRIYDLLVSTSKESVRVINDLFTIVGNFVLFHELGHAYTSQYGTGFIRASFAIPSGVDLSPETVRSIRMHPNGPIYNEIDLPGSQNGLLVITPLLEHWKEEFSSDVFAAYADVLAGAEGKPRATDLERFVSALTCWQVVLFAIGSRQQYMRAIAGDVASADFSHPVAHARVDLLIHHLNFLAEEFAPEWQSPGITLLKSHYDSLWAEDVIALLQDSIEYVRYGFDGDGPDINVGKVRTFTGDPVPSIPTALSKLEENFLNSFLMEADRVGWEPAIKANREKFASFLNTFTLNDRPIIVEMGRRLREINMRFISEDRE